MLAMQRVFKNIAHVSEKYIGCESYVVRRMQDLSINPDRFHHFEIEMSYEEASNTALPSDPEIIASVFTGFQDLNLMNTKH